MFVLDTDTLTHLYAGHPRVVRNLQQSEDPDAVTTIITKIELLRGRFDFALKAETGAEILRAQYLLALTEDLLAQIQILPFDVKAGKNFDQLRANTGLRKIGRADLLIASICLAERAVLVTRNVRHFQRIPGLRVVNWVD
jgi:tRNA(fMet)-specific endonuclease VapC